MARPAGRNEPPVLLVKWYDVTKWLLERVDSFPKNQRFVFGQRIADRALNILEALVDAVFQILRGSAEVYDFLHESHGTLRSLMGNSVPTQVPGNRVTEIVFRQKRSEFFG